jgi:hypothetical protein
MLLSKRFLNSSSLAACLVALPLLALWLLVLLCVVAVLNFCAVVLWAVSLVVRLKVPLNSGRKHFYLNYPIRT